MYLIAILIGIIAIWWIATSIVGILNLGAQPTKILNLVISVACLLAVIYYTFPNHLLGH